MAAKKMKTVKGKKIKKKVDIEDLLGELHARLDAIGEKLDALLSKYTVLLRMVSTERDPGFKTHATVAKKFPIPQDNVPRERKMYKAVCAECNVSCEVPFVPRADRPVYCKSCYSNRRNEKNAGNIPNREQIVAEIAKTFQIDMSEKSKPETPKTKKAKAGASKTKKTGSGKAKAKKNKTKK
jgi:CxxC-x17-CxxC domain-containing protein